LGFPGKEMAPARQYIEGWSMDEQESLLLLGNLDHDQFLSLLTRCFAYVRTPACDGVSASVLESLALGIPVIASENGTRPPGVITYREDDATQLCDRMLRLIENHKAVREELTNHAAQSGDDNIGKMADWLTGTPAAISREEVTDAV